MKWPTRWWKRSRKVNNTEAWDRLALLNDERSGPTNDTVAYGPYGPTEADLRLLGDMSGKRVLELGCGSGATAIALARQGAHVIAVDGSSQQLARARQRADRSETRCEWHQADLADLAFLRAESIDVALSVFALSEVEDVSRVFRQVHRVLRPHAPFVFSYEHPLAWCTSEAPDNDGLLGPPLGSLLVTRPYAELGDAVEARPSGESMMMYPRTISAVFVALGRCGFRVDTLLEPGNPGSLLPSAVVWRARKEGS